MVGEGALGDVGVGGGLGCGGVGGADDEVAVLRGRGEGAVGEFGGCWAHGRSSGWWRGADVRGLRGGDGLRRWGGRLG